jgi:hypothetical protein
MMSCHPFPSQFDKMNKRNQRSAMKIYVQQLNTQIEEIVLEMRQLLTTSELLLGIEQCIHHVLADEYKKFETVLTIDVHTRDMVDALIRDGINELHDL